MDVFANFTEYRQIKNHLQFTAILIKAAKARHIDMVNIAATPAKPKLKNANSTIITNVLVYSNVKDRVLYRIARNF